MGKQTFFRVFSGTLTADSRVFNPNKNAEERLGQLYVMRGKEQIPVASIKAGDIGAVAKLTVTATGDTLCDKAHPLTFTPTTYPRALVSIAIEPKTAADSAKMGPTLSRLIEEDPTLHWFNDPSTWQTVLEGLGDSHIDVAVRRAKAKFGVELVPVPRRIPYRETVMPPVQRHAPSQEANRRLRPVRRSAYAHRANPRQGL